jgi:hypothetical protein
MKRLILKLSTLVLLSVTYGAALSGNLTANPVKDATKTNFVCICSNGFEVICHTSCEICCR